MLQAIIRRLKREKRGISTAIVAMLSLVIVVIIVGNVVLWSYQMNQLDLERMQETVTIANVTRIEPFGTQLDIKNTSPISVHIVAIWISNSTVHQRYDANLFLNSGESATYVREDISFPQDGFVAKIVTERGNIAIFSES
jgi:Na+-transporting NADH:ubiquinone oxidoreductase subunit NqrC